MAILYSLELIRIFLSMEVVLIKRFMVKEKRYMGMIKRRVIKLPILALDKQMLKEII
jgi:hypothetical protein